MIVTPNTVVYKAYWCEDLWKSNWHCSLMFSTNIKNPCCSHPQLPKVCRVSFNMYLVPPPSPLLRPEENHNGMWGRRPSRLGLRSLFGGVVDCPGKTLRMYSGTALWGGSDKNAIALTHGKTWYLEFAKYFFRLLWRPRSHPSEFSLAFSYEHNIEETFHCYLSHPQAWEAA